MYTHVYARAVYARAVAWTSALCVRVGACVAVVAVTFAVGHPADELPSARTDSAIWRYAGQAVCGCI